MADIGTISGTLELRDDMSPKLRLAQQEVAKLNTAVAGLEKHTSSLPPIKALQIPQADVQKVAEFERRMADLGRATTTANTAGREFVGGFVRSLAAGAVLGGTAAITGLAYAAVQSATSIDSLSKRTGIISSELDRLSRLGGPAGVTLDAIGHSAEQLEKNLVNGKAGVVGAVKELGIALDRTPRGEVYLQIVQRLAQIDDPAERARLQIEALGNTDIEPLIEEFRRTGGVVAHMSDASITGIATFQRAIKTWTQAAQSDIGNLIGAFTSLRGAMDFLLSRSPIGENILGAQSFFNRLPATLAASSPGGTAAFQSPDASSLRPRLADEFKKEADAITRETEKQIADRERLALKMKETLDQFNRELVRMTFYPMALPGKVDLEAFGMGPTMAAPGLTSQDPMSGRFVWGAQGIPDLIRATTPRIPSLWPKVGGIYPFLEQFGDMRTPMGAPPAPSWSDRMFGQSTSQFGAMLGGTVTGSIMGGGNIGQAVGSQIGESIGNKFGRMASKSVGGTMGGVLGSALPFVGSLLGPAIGWLGDKFFGTKGRDTVRDFEQQFGGGDALRTRLDEIGRGDLNQRLFQGVGRNDEKGAKAAIDAVTKALQESEDALKRYGLTMDDLKSPTDRAAGSLKRLTDDIAIFERMGVKDIDNVAKKMAGPLNDAIRDVLDTGGKLPASMQPYIEALIRSGQLNDELARKILGLPAPDKVPWEEMERVADEFGISIDALGPRFQQSKLTETADELGRKFHLLVDNGADVGSVVVGMKDKANDFLASALKWGLEIPPSLKPLYTALFNNGELVDENGEKVEDFNKLKFGVDLTESIGDLIEKLDDLIERLGSIPNPVITPQINPPVYVGGTPPSGVEGDHSGSTDPIDRGRPGYEAEDGLGFALGTGGRYLDFGTGTRVTLHGRERVMTEAEGRASAMGNDDMLRELRALRGDLTAQRGELTATFSTLPHMLATQLAGQLAMVRR